MPARRAPAKASTRPGTKPDTTVDAGLQRWSRLLTKAEKDPEIVLEDRRCLKPQFVARFFDICDGKALEAPWAAQDYADAALALAEKLGERHLMNVAEGIAVHTCISTRRWAEADERLQAYRQQAFDCCPTCTSDWLRRQGDLLVETLDPVLSRAYLQRAAETLGDELDDASRGRILFVRGIAHLYLGNRERALDDGGEALRLLSLEAPQGYFMDAIAQVGFFLERSSDHLLAVQVRNRPRYPQDALHCAAGELEAVDREVEQALSGRVRDRVAAQLG